VRVLLKRRRGERGVVAILVALLSVVLLVMMAFTADLGMAYAQRQALGAGADSAALAIVHSEYVKQLKNPTRTCSSTAAVDGAAARSIALAQINANAPFGKPLTASQIQVSLSCVGAGALSASVRVSKTVPTTFGQVAGSSGIGINRSSVANLAVVNRVTGVEPIGVCRYQAQAIIDDAAADLSANKPYRSELMSLSKVWTGNRTCDGSGGAGNWGWLDLGQGNAESALGQAIQDGSSTPLTVSGSPPTLTLDGTPGNRANGNPVHAGMAAIMDKTVVLPVYGSYSGNGANVTYTVNGFLTVKMCGYDKTTTGTCYDPSVPMTGDDMQLRFVSYAPVGKLDSICGLGDTSCSFDSFTTGLTG
jgi:Flp pilus assembly protein TadG